LVVNKAKGRQSAKGEWASRFCVMQCNGEHVQCACKSLGQATNQGMLY
jgi:hypothetical protein